MAVYDLDNVNEEYEETDALDNMLEACEYMIDMLDESTATQRHYGVTSKDIGKNYDLGRSILNGSKGGKLINKIDDVETKSKAYGKYAAGAIAKNFHNGKTDKKIDDMIDGKGIGGKIANKYGTYDSMSDREKEESKAIAKASARGSAGAILGRMAANGTDVKGAYSKAAAKADKKKAVKETCLYILSRLDDIE